MDSWEWVALCMNGLWGCKAYSRAIGIAVENDSKQNKAEEDFHKVLAV